MTPATACCATCCLPPITTLPTFMVRGGSAWSDAIALGLVVTGVLLTGLVILVQVVRALAILGVL